MITKESFAKEVSEFSTVGKTAIAELLRLHVESVIPNQMTNQNDDQSQFNIVLGEHLRNLHINFSVYLANINSYMLELVMFFPQDDIHFPKESTKETALMTFTGAPMLGAVSYEKPISALSLHEAIEAAIEYVYDNFENMAREAMGGAGL